MKTLDTLFETLPQVGRVDWIGVRPARREPMQCLEKVQVDPSAGLHGDRYAGRSGARHITIIQAEHLPVIASCLGLKRLDSAVLRRNLVVSGINLLALKDKIFHIGEVRLQVTGLCNPCSYIEQALGPGGYNAVRGHGGVTARVLNEGIIAIGDAVSYPQPLVQE